MLKRNISYHLSEDRPYRVFHILSTVGLGNTIKEIHCIDEQGRPAWKCLTDTGVIQVLNEEKTRIITLYIATQPLVSAMFKGQTPGWVLKMIHKNKKHAEIQNNTPLLKQIYGEI